MYAFRTDIGQLRPAKRMPDGRIRVDAYIGRAGVLEYADPTMPGGIRRELRDDGEVFNQDTLDSFAQVPVTDQHPPMMLDADSAPKYMKGASGESVVRDGEYMRSPLMVADRKLIQKMDAGVNECSSGYSCIIVDEPGVHPKYGRYDVKQTKIRGNHVAILERGRAGRMARARMDAELTAEERNNLRESQFAVPSTGQLPIHDAEHTRGAMARFNQTDFPSTAAKATAYNKIVAAAKRFGIDSSGFEEKFSGRSDEDRNRHGGVMDPEKLQEANRALNAQLKTATERADAAEEKLKGETFRADKAEEQNKGLKEQVSELQARVSNVAEVSEKEAVKTATARADAAETKLTDYERTFGERVRERARLERKAIAVLGTGYRMDDLSDVQIMTNVVKKLKPTINLTGASEGVVQGRFDQLYEQFEGNAQNLARASEIIAAADTTVRDRTDRNRPDPNEYSVRAKNAWKHPGKFTTPDLGKDR